VRAAPAGAEVDELRLPAFHFLFILVFIGIGETGVAKRNSEAPPLEFLFRPGLRASAYALRASADSNPP
jgi:hypothetical protein